MECNNWIHYSCIGANLQFTIFTTPPGIVIGFILCYSYVNKAHNLLTYVCNKVRLYADDILLYSYVYSKDDRVSLQQGLNALEQWSLKWQMLFNPSFLTRRAP